MLAICYISGELVVLEDAPLSGEFPATDTYYPDASPEANVDEKCLAQGHNMLIPLEFEQQHLNLCPGK